MTARYCHVPMSVLRVAPYNLQYNELVVAKVRAKNTVGWSAQSSPNVAGAAVQTEPFQTSAP